MSKKRKFFILIITLTIVEFIAILSLAFTVRSSTIQSLITAEGNKQEVLSEEISKVLETEIQSIQEKLNLTAKFPEIQSLNPDACNQKLTEVFDVLESKVNNLIRINADGVIYCAVNKDALGINTLTDPDFKTIILEDPDHKPIMHRIKFSPVSNKFVVGVHVPIFDKNNKFLGTVGGVIYFQDLEKKYLDGIRLNKDQYIVLIDDNGDILHYPQKELMGKNFNSKEVQKLIGTNTVNQAYKQLLTDSSYGKNGTVRHNFDNIEQLTSYSSANIFPDRRWIVVVGIGTPTIVTQAMPGNILSVPIALIAIILFVAILTTSTFIIFLYQSKELFDPLIKIRDLTKRIGSGNFEIDFEPKLISSKDEFGELARSLQQMAFQLKNYYTGLEEKVTEKTILLDEKVKELQKNNQTLENTQTAMVHVMKDLQIERNKLAEDEVKDQAILSSIGDGVFVSDSEGKLLMMNVAAEK